MASDAKTVLRTLVLLDLVGSTALVQRVGDQRAAALFAQTDRLCRDLLVAHDGREIDRTDGFLLTFEATIDAVRFILAYHRALAALSAESGEELTARAGVHTGEVVVRENSAEDIARGAKPIEVDGLTKPTAARIMSKAGGGQTLLSARAASLAQRAVTGQPDAVDWVFVEHGPYALKGLDTPMVIWEVSEGTTRAPEGRWEPPRRLVPWRALAVGLAMLTMVGALALWPREHRGSALVLTSGGWTAAGPTVGDWEAVLVGTGRLGRTERLERHTDLGGPLDLFTDQFLLDERTHFDSLRDPDAPRPYAVEQSHDIRGRVSEVTFLLSSGVALATERWHWEDGQTAMAACTTPAGAPISVDDALPGLRSPWRRYRFDEQGFLTAIEPLDEAGVPLSDTVLQLASDEQGMPRSLREVGADGTPVELGYAMRFVREEGRLLARTLLGRGESPMAGRDGCATWTTGLAEGEDRIRRCLDVHGEARPFLQLGCYGLRLEVGDAQHYAWACLDAEDEPMPSAVGWTRLAVTRDALGFTQRVRGLDGSGGPAPVHASGVHSYGLAHDSRGRIAEVGPLLGADGTALATPHLGLGQRWLRDERDLLVERRSVDAEGAPFTHPSGYASSLMDYDTHGRNTRVAYYDAKGQPVQPVNEGHAVTFTYEGWSPFPAVERQLDTALEPVVTKEVGAAERRFTTHHTGELTSVALFGTEGEPIRGPHEPFWHATGQEQVSCHRMLSELDARGRLVSRRCTDVDGALHAHEEGWAVLRTRRARASDGHELVEFSFFDAGEQPTWTTAGFARHEHHLDDLGRVIEHISWGPLGEPALEQGCHRRVLELDAWGKPTHERCDGPTGEPAVGLDGDRCAERNWTYAAGGQPLTVTCQDVDGSLMPGTDGVAYRERTLDSAGRVVEERFFGGDRQPVNVPELGAARLEHEFDTAGRLVGLVAWAADASPAVLPGPPNGLPLLGHRLRISYGPDGREDAITAVGPDGAPMPVARLELSFDSSGYLDGFTYRDAEGRLVIGPPGYATLVSPNRPGTSQTRARLILDASGQPLPQFGCARLSYVQEDGAEITRCEDATGQPSTGVGGWSTQRIEQRWDGQPGGWAWFGADGSPVDGPQGPHREERTYQLGKLVAVAWFSADGSPTAPVAAERIERDHLGRELRRFLEAPDGSVFPYGPDCGVQLTERDSAGHVTQHCAPA